MIVRLDTCKRGWPVPTTRLVIAGLLVSFLLTGCGGGDPYAHLSVGDCVRGNPNRYPVKLEVIDCNDFQALQDHKVLGISRVPDGEYPNSFAQYDRDCSGITISPGRDTWADGDRTVLCLGVFSGN